MLLSWTALQLPKRTRNQAVYSSGSDDGTLKEWDAAALALKRDIDLGGKSSALRIEPRMSV